MGICNKINKYLKHQLRSLIGWDVISSSNMTNQTCPIYNINQSFDLNQKRIAFVYIRNAWNTPMQIQNIYHANLIHQVAMIKVLCKLGYCLDIYSCSPENICVPDSNYTDKYDIIFGFGTQYLQLCKSNLSAKKILFITENAPWVVREKYNRRLTYFHKRHPNLILHDSHRTDFYTDEMFKISDVGIAVTGTYNLLGIQKRLSSVYRLDVNGLFNKSFNIHNPKDHTVTKTHFVWFGSRGFIHKGLDILIDAFASLPQLYLDVYGISREEFLGMPIPKNVSLCGMVNVMEDSFISNVINKNTFVISLSCSEGMQTGITTCMIHGLIPIVTKECGVEDHEDVLIFEGYDIESVKSTLLAATQISAIELREKEIRIHKKSVVDFSVESFAINFEQCIVKSLSDELS